MLKINLGVAKGTRWRAPLPCAGSRPSQASSAEGPSPGPRSAGSPGKRRVGATELLKKFIKMSSSTETQRVRNATEEERGRRGTGHGSHVANSRDQKAPYTHTRQLQRGTDNERKRENPTPKPAGRALVRGGPTSQGRAGTGTPCRVWGRPAGRTGALRTPAGAGRRGGC